MKDFTLRELQTNLPWTIRYSEDFRKTPLTHKDFAHGLTHIGKAMGKLHGLVDDMDHNRALADSPELKKYSKYVADLVVCALRLANTFPGGVLDLQNIVQERLETKNNVKLEKQVCNFCTEKCNNPECDKEVYKKKPSKTFTTSIEEIVPRELWREPEAGYIEVLEARIRKLEAKIRVWG